MINYKELVRKGHERLLFHLTLLLPLLLIFVCVQANATDFLIVPVTIEGTVYNAKLQENKALLRKLGKLFNSGKAHHYKGVIEGVADSWIRVSKINGNWQGIASVNGVLEIIDSTPPTTTPQGVKTTGLTPLRSTPASNFNNMMKKCGVSLAQSPTSTLSTTSSTSSTSSTFTTINAAQPVADALSLSTICANKVDGVCMVAQLELIFDQDFQTLITTKLIQNTTTTPKPTVEDEAASLISMVEGFYKNDLNISFDAITVTMLPSTSTLFTTSTDASTLLADIADKKSTLNGIPFLKNHNALTHLITGRDFTGSVVGIAYVSSVCEPKYSVGTSSVVLTTINGVANSPNIPLTSLVMAHELGHNFGASHDGDGNTCLSTGYIMESTLDANATPTHFSSCSVKAIQNQIDTATKNFDPTLCFNFPVDAGITADSGNHLSVNRNDPFALLYTVSLVNGYHPAAQLVIKGSVNTTGGVLGSVSVDGNACSVSGGTSYTCTVNKPGTSLALSVGGTANGSGNQLQLTHSVSVQDSQVFDLNGANDQLTDTISIVDPVTSPGIKVTPTTGLTTSESGATASFTVVLDSQPANAVTVNLSSSDTTEGTVSPSSITFTAANWNTSQKITVTGVDDNLVDGDIKYNVSFTVQSADSNYNGFTITPVSLTNKDNDSQASPTNSGGSTSNSTTSSNSSSKGGAVGWWWIMCCGFFIAIRRRNSLRTLTI